MNKIRTKSFNNIINNKKTSLNHTSSSNYFFRIKMNKDNHKDRNRSLIYSHNNKLKNNK